MTEPTDSISKAKKIMEEGWKSREALDFDKAEVLLNQAKEIFIENQDWFNVTECLNGLAYSQKLQAVQHVVKGLELAESSYALADLHGTKKVLVLRALMSLASSAGNFELALKYARAALELYGKPMDCADILSHISTFQMRTGDLAASAKTIEEAEALFTANIDQVAEPHRSTWQVRLYLTKGITLFNQGKKAEAKECGEQALKIATEKSLKTRMAEVTSFLKLFND